jgi:hypothetical protein
MKLTKKSATVLTIIISLSLMSLTVRADQPRMEAAKDDLNNALKYLRKATADKGGHRERAIDLVSQAISSVNRGIQYDRKTPNRFWRRNSNFVENNLFIPANSATDQPNMQKAKDYLRSALDNLNRATADKGGYRTEAIRLTREAINEVERGIAFDRRN